MAARSTVLAAPPSRLTWALPRVVPLVPTQARYVPLKAMVTEAPSVLVRL